MKYTIKLSKKSGSSHTPFNTLFFASPEEAQAWFDKNQADTLALIEQHGHSLEVIKEEGIYSLNKLPIEKEDNTICAPFQKKATERGYNIISAYQAYVENELEIIPTCVVKVNEEVIPVHFADDRGEFTSRLRDNIENYTMKQLLEGVVIKSITIDGVELDWLHYFELFDCYGQKPSGMFTFEQAEELFMYDRLLDNDIDDNYCTSVADAVKYAANSVVKNNYRRMKEGLSSLKKLLK